MSHLGPLNTIRPMSPYRRIHKHSHEVGGPGTDNEQRLTVAVIIFSCQHSVEITWRSKNSNLAVHSVRDMSGWSPAILTGVFRGFLSPSRQMQECILK